MNEQSIIALIDVEIARMQTARNLLVQGSSIDGSTVRKATRGRKPGRTGAKKRTLSPEARKRIAEAQRKRWAKTKRLAQLSAVGKKRAAKKSARKAANKAEASAAVPF